MVDYRKRDDLKVFLANTRAENADLRIENKDLKAEIKTLKTKVALLEAQIKIAPQAEPAPHEVKYLCICTDNEGLPNGKRFVRNHEVTDLFGDFKVFPFATDITTPEELYGWLVQDDDGVLSWKPRDTDYDYPKWSF